MSKVLAAAPVWCPVYRTRVDLVIRDLTSAAHLALEDLREAGRDADWFNNHWLQWSAALLGLRLTQIENLNRELQGSGGKRGRSERLWFDMGHGSVLAAERGLDLLPPAKVKHLPLMPIPAPSPGTINRDELLRALNLHDAQRRGRVQVDDVLAVNVDDDERSQHSHILGLPDCQLVVCRDGHELTCELWSHGVPDDDLTAAVDLCDGLNPQHLHLVGADEARERLQTDLGLSCSDVQAVDALDPGTVRHRFGEIIAGAQRRLIVALPAGVKHAAAWLADALALADTDVEVVVVHSEPRPPRLAGQSRTATMQQACPALVVIADDDRAIAHSSREMGGARWRLGDLRAQSMIAIETANAVAAITHTLGVPQLPTKTEDRPAKTERHAAAQALRARLEEMEGGSQIVLDADVDEILLRLERYGRTASASQLAPIVAGVAWERVVYDHIAALAAEHARFADVTLRRELPGERLDIDVVVHDLQLHIFWVIDAKCATPTTASISRDVAQVAREIRLATDHSVFPPGLTARGLLVYPSAHASKLPRLTTRRNVECVALEGLSQRLLNPS